MIRKIYVNVLLVLFASTVSLGGVEFLVRFFYPEYKYAADSLHLMSPDRIFERQPNTRALLPHPDTRDPHWVIHNELAQRQHRKRPLRRISKTTKIGFFGDSFTENQRIASQYSFVEIVDYLLNSNTEDRFDCFNFGVEGYGTDQEFLYYQESSLASELELVFYVFCANDIRNNYSNKLFELGRGGDVLRQNVKQPSMVIRFLSKLYLTYFVQDAYFALVNSTRAGTVTHGFLSGLLKPDNFDSSVMEQDLLAGKLSDSVVSATQLFKKIIFKWGEEVRANKANFVIITLPRPEEKALRDMFNSDYSVLDLWELFYPDESCSNYEECHALYMPWRFKANDHWNEAGNLKAAIIIYKYLASYLGLPDRGEEWLQRKITNYYMAFPGGWRPTLSLMDHSCSPDPEIDWIREKYLELELR